MGFMWVFHAQVHHHHHHHLSIRDDPDTSNQKQENTQEGSLHRMLLKYYDVIVVLSINKGEGHCILRISTSLVSSSVVFACSRRGCMSTRSSSDIGNSGIIRRNCCESRLLICRVIPPKEELDSNKDTK